MALTKVQKAKKLLNQYAPKGEKLAYINNKEAKLLKKLGGAGIDINGTGIKSYIEYDDSYGSGHASASSSSSDSSSNGGGGEGVYYPPTQPSTPAPTFDYESEAYNITPSPDYETDLEEIGKDTGYVTLLKGKDRTEARLGELVDFALNTEGANFVNPLDEFGIKGSVYANTGFTPISGPNVTYDTIANLPPPQPKGILQTIGGGLKTAAKVALPFVAPAFLPASLAKGYTTYNQARAISRLANLATKGRTGTLPTLREAFTKFQGTGNRVPNTATGYESDGDNRLVPKNVIAANVQKYSPAQINNLQSNIALLESVLDSGQYRGTKLNRSQLSQISNQRNSLLEQYNMIQEYLV